MGKDKRPYGATVIIARDYNTTIKECLVFTSDQEENAYETFEHCKHIYGNTNVEMVGTALNHIPSNIIRHRENCDLEEFFTTKDFASMIAKTIISKFSICQFKTYHQPVGDTEAQKNALVPLIMNVLVKYFTYAADRPVAVSPYENFGKEFWNKNLERLRSTKCFEESDEELLEIASNHGLVKSVIYDPAIHEGVEDCEPGDEIWWWD